MAHSITSMPNVVCVFDQHGQASVVIRPGREETKIRSGQVIRNEINHSKIMPLT